MTILLDTQAQILKTYTSVIVSSNIPEELIIIPTEAQDMPKSNK